MHRLTCPTLHPDDVNEVQNYISRDFLGDIEYFREVSSAAKNVRLTGKIWRILIFFFSNYFETLFNFIKI